MSARNVAAGLLLEVRPLPMAAAMLTVLLGAGWAQGGFQSLGPPALSLIVCVFFGLYTAHLMDTYIDSAKRGEQTPGDYPWYFRDSSGLIAPRSYPLLIAVSTAACALLAVGPAAAGGPVVALLLAFGLALALAYAPLLDRRTLGVSLGYPAGVAAVLTASFLSVGGRLDPSFAILVLALALALAGTKIRSDVIDLDDDTKAHKRTVAVAWGARRAERLGYGLAYAGLALAAALPFAFPVSPALAAPALGAAVLVAATARRGAMESSTAMAVGLFMLLVADVVILAAAPWAPLS